MMIRFLRTAGVFVLILLPNVTVADESHVVTQADALKWTAAPPSLPPGAQISVLLGNPSAEGLYVIRLKFPAGYKIPAHTHPNDEHVTVISGAFHFGLGAKLDETKGTKLTAGGFAHAAKGMQHYAWASEETVVQVHGLGPQGISYVDPNDDPRKKSQ